MIYSIGEVAKRLYVSTQSLRNWERQQLIQKAKRRPTGYRMYDEQDVERIRQFLKERER